MQKEINKNVTYFLTHTAKGNNRKKVGDGTETYPRPHVESNHDLAFRKRPFYPLNYRGGIKQ